MFQGNIGTCYDSRSSDFLEIYITKVQMRGKGTITFPAKLRAKYNLQEGEVFTLIDMGGRSFLLKPQIYEVDKISSKIGKQIQEEGVTLEELFETLGEVRKELFQERYGNGKQPSND